MRKTWDGPSGSVRTIHIDGTALADNLLEDPTRRRVDLYVPAGSTGEGLPLLVDLAGFTGSGLGHTNWKNFGENLPERLDRLIGSGRLAPCVVAFPDCFTRLGGNQYINSAATGRWEDYLITEAVPAIETRLGCGGPRRRGVFGKSSGGYGAIIHAMRHGGSFWAAAACHSGDMAFELCYLAEMPAILRGLAPYEFSAEAFIAAFEGALKTKGTEITILMMLAMAATYDPDPTQPFGVRLPVTTDTCEVIPERWRNWRRWDPVEMIDTAQAVDNLKSLKALLVDCGDADQYDLVHGARRFRNKLAAAGVPHRYEEFPDNHSSVDYRMDVSLPYLAAALTA